MKNFFVIFILTSSLFAQAQEFQIHCQAAGDKPFVADISVNTNDPHDRRIAHAVFSVNLEESGSGDYFGNISSFLIHGDLRDVEMKIVKLKDTTKEDYMILRVDDPQGLNLSRLHHGGENYSAVCQTVTEPSK